MSEGERTGLPGNNETVAELQHLCTASPADPALRRKLAEALYAEAIEACSLTRDRVRVMTSERQRILCEHHGRRILELGVDDLQLVRAASDLLDEVHSGSRWIWHPRGVATAVATAAIVGGLVSVTIAALAGSPVVAGVAAVLGSGLLALVVLRFRRETWRVRADGLRMVVWQPGI